MRLHNQLTCETSTSSSVRKSSSKCLASFSIEYVLQQNCCFSDQNSSNSAQKQQEHFLSSYCRDISTPYSKQFMYIFYLHSVFDRKQTTKYSVQCRKRKPIFFFFLKKTIYIVFCYIDIPQVINVATPTQDMSVVLKTSVCLFFFFFHY